MKILVFDDSEIHRLAAEALLKGHDLTIVETYDEAEKALQSHTDYKKANALTPPEYRQWKRDAGPEWEKAFEAANKKAKEAATTHPHFDCVLTDLLVPASRKAQGAKGEQFVGQEMPLGTVIALRALAAGVKLVAVVTDMNHHDHPASAAFDGFARFSVGGDVKVLCTNEGATVYLDEVTLKEVSYQFVQTDEGMKKYPKRSDHTRMGLVRGKAWHSVLARLLEE